MSVGIRGDFPGKATNPDPASGSDYVTYDPTDLSWTAPSYAGDVWSGAPSLTYEVRASSACGAPIESYGVVPGCSFSRADPSSTSCSSSGFFGRDTGYCWYVVTNNNEYMSVSDLWNFETEDPVIYQNWATALYGNFYAGSVNVQLPSFTDSYVAPWGPPAAGNGPFMAYEKDPTAGLPDAPDVAFMAAGDANISYDDSVSGYQPYSQSQVYAVQSIPVEYSAKTWPHSQAYESGSPPTYYAEYFQDGDSHCPGLFNPGASSIPGLGPGDRLADDEVYLMDLGCAQQAINDTDSLGGYDIRATGGAGNRGVATVYVTGSGTLRFDSPFVYEGGDTSKRILFVLDQNIDVAVDQDLSTADPDFNTVPIIQAAFVVNNDFTFEGIQGSGVRPEEDPNQSIVVEGPIIVKGNIEFKRNRGLTNGYPSQVIKYLNKYIYDMTDKERRIGSVESNYNGLFVVDLTWEVEQ
jgi:hypothetical protein